MGERLLQRLLHIETQSRSNRAHSLLRFRSPPAAAPRGEGYTSSHSPRTFSSALNSSTEPSNTILPWPIT